MNIDFNPTTKMIQGQNNKRPNIRIKLFIRSL